MGLEPDQICSICRQQLQQSVCEVYRQYFQYSSC